MPASFNYNWTDLAFASKKPISSLNATFIAAPREISAKRFIQLVKQYLPNGNIVLGLADEEYVEGFAGQQQFRMLKLGTVQAIIDKANASASPNKIYTMAYFQRDFDYILQKLDFARVVLINGSWQKSFHTLPAFYTLVSKKTPFVYVSPFADQAEAKDYDQKHSGGFGVDISKAYSAEQMLGLAHEAGKQSFDTSFQVGAVLGKKSGNKYKYVVSAYNQVVPYETYAWHNGASREKHFSPTNDQNYYDTVHAETCILINCLQANLFIDDTTLFITVLPCPSCARMIAATPISEIYYQLDHSDGYAVKLLEAAGKKVTRKV